MRRKVLGYAALAIAIALVFAPRPTGRDDITSSEYGSLFSRVLAPTVDDVDVRERNVTRATTETAPLWLALFVVLLAYRSPKLLYLLLEPRPSRLRRDPVAGRGCRAPPAPSV